ncbi:16S rRNA (guanine(966)-N(2))-methyltransferase RsmD [Candidatus Mikella endobia]|uniref:16S rRNA (guanine(966)-N(2))-methyltransferase RsmD n=1 Tax=Candidatus Mikella endobia TaxID=1778264 RepID=UPI0038B7BF02
MSNNKKNNGAGKIRIIGGRWRGSILLVPKIPGLRPTPNRVRETLFNWLAPVIRGAHCLDCFSGSGALGLEALSRYAASITLIEQDKLISKQLFKNLQVLQTKQAHVITTDTHFWLAHSSYAKFDIVFIDPPFHQGMISKTVYFLEYYQHLAQKSWIYIETEKESPYPAVPRNWNIYKEKVAGKVAYRLYLRNSPT